MPWKALGPIIQLINRLLDWFDKQQRERDYEQRQDKRKDLENDSARAAADHFDGRVYQLRDDGTVEPTPKDPDKAND